MLYSLTTFFKSIWGFLLSTNNWSLLSKALLILVLFAALERIYTLYLIPRLLQRFQSQGKPVVYNIFHSSLKPIRWCILLGGLYIVGLYLPLGPGLDLLLRKLFRSLLVVLVCWALYELSGNESLLSWELLEKLKVDSILVPFFAKVVRIFIVSLAIIMIAHEWGYDANGFIAGLGLGGLAFALAAKDALANIFGGVVILLEKPFSIGDWVYTPSVEGVVEDISFRSTRFRTFAQALITVPNSTLAGEPITNWSRMGKRRVSFYVGISYMTPPDRITAFMDEIRALLQSHSGVHPETIQVVFEKFEDSSLSILVYYFTNTTVWGEHQVVKEDINLAILRIAETQNISLAFPTRTIYLEQGS